jgi:penicillin amidase
VGAPALDADVETRHLGMPRAAELAFAALPDSATGKRFATAYAAGVNAWIDGLRPATWPVEYKLLGTRPSRWQPLNTMHLYNRMGHTLTYSPVERERQVVEGLIGAPALRAAFPVNAPIQEPIQPNGTGAARDDFRPLPAAGTPDTGAIAQLPRWLRSRLESDDSELHRVFASNNWAVAPSRSRSGNALLAGDPHLELTLPSIWYEAHLVVPGQLDVYGVTIPGAPGVTIGFNRDVAWSLTNTGADVIDFFRETVDDHGRPAKHLVDDRWRDLVQREEVYRDKRGKVLHTDTVMFTYRGPLTKLGSDWASMRWTVLEPADLVNAFNGAAHATTAVGLLDAFARDYFAPAQNVITADRQGNIGIRSTGHFPIRAGDGSGLTIRDGSLSSNDWQGYWSVAEYPQSINPPQGFVASANQQPIDPLQRARYMGYDTGFEPWRALQINRLLREADSIAFDDMRRFQTDPGSVRADRFVHHFLAATSQARASGYANDSLRAADSVLSRWDRRYTVDNTGAILFETAMAELGRRTWDELIPPSDSVRVAVPSTGVLLQLLSDSTSTWWDDRRTSDRVEDRNLILQESLAAAYQTVVRRFGAPDSARWAWGRVGPAAVNHMLGLTGFSRRDVPIQGGRGTLNPSAQRTGFGASWRMVVELGARVRAMGTYPGGQSGNPASARYDDRLRFWQRGELELLHAPPAVDSMTAEQVRASLTLSPAATR